VDLIYFVSVFTDEYANKIKGVMFTTTICIYICINNNTGTNIEP
jgi:hypothetical protein